MGLFTNEKFESLNDLFIEQLQDLYDAEKRLTKALPQMAVTFLPEVLIGLTLAGIFAATMSTADSQILACSAAVTQDVAPRWSEDVKASKLATLAGILVG